MFLVDTYWMVAERLQQLTAGLGEASGWDARLCSGIAAIRCAAAGACLGLWHMHVTCRQHSQRGGCFDPHLITNECKCM